MWIKTRCGELHETTGASVQLLTAPAKGKDAPARQYLALVTTDGERGRLLEYDVTPERAQAILSRLERAIASGQVLVEVP